MSLHDKTSNSLRAALRNTAAHLEVKNILDQGAGAVDTATFTVGTEDGNSAIAVSVQLKDPQGNAIAEKRIVDAHVLNGNLTAYNTGTLTFAGVTGDIVATVANKRYALLTTAAGSLSFTITASGASTVQLAVPTVGGQYVASGNITHAS